MNTTTKILVIDDEEIILKSCLNIFRLKDNVAVDTASSGTEGIKKTNEKKYDLVITDLMMPNLSGMDVLRTLCAEQPEVTVIIFTGYATVESVREALKLGAFDYIPKPFTPDELIEVVDNAIKKRKDMSNVKMLDLMAIVSHELKSPVDTMFSSVDALKKGYFGKLAPAQQKTIDAVIRNCVYLEDIIRNFIDLSKMEIGDLEFFSEDIDLAKSVIQPVLDLPDHQNNFRNMQIITDFKTLPQVYGDPNLLKIVVTNFVNNAIKYGSPDTTIVVTLSEDDSRYVCSVYNEGVGISKEEIKHRLFNRFARLKQKGTEGVKGSGLGLYICKKIIEKHGGEVWVNSEEGQWSKFFFSLPK